MHPTPSASVRMPALSRWCFRFASCAAAFVVVFSAAVLVLLAGQAIGGHHPSSDFARRLAGDIPLWGAGWWITRSLARWPDPAGTR